MVKKLYNCIFKLYFSSFVDIILFKVYYSMFILVLQFSWNALQYKHIFIWFSTNLIPELLMFKQDKLQLLSSIISYVFVEITYVSQAHYDDSFCDRRIYNVFRLFSVVKWVFFYIISKPLSTFI